MFAVNFWKFNKQGNSTKVPQTAGESFDCVILRGSSIISPVLQLDLGVTTAPDFNYCYISNFGRYYHVTEWTFNNRLWTANLKVDALATYKTPIGSANLYALRTSNSSLYDGRIVDSIYPTKAGCTFNTVSITKLWEAPATNSGTYVVGAVSKNGDFGSLKYYANTPFEFTTANQYLLDDALLTENQFNLDGASDSMIKSLVDPLQFIKSCTYIPLNTTDIASNLTSNIDYVLYDWNVKYAPAGATIQTRAVKPDGVTFTLTRTVNIPKHPQTSSRGNYVNLSPYTILTLFVPPFGNIDIDTTVTANASTLTLEINIDLPTGLGVMEVKCNGILLNSISAQVGVPVNMSQVTRDYIGGVNSTINGIFGTLGSALSGDVGGAVMNASSGIASAVNSMAPRSNSIGGGGSYSQLLTEQPRLDAQFFEIVDDDIEKNGRPCCKIVNCSVGGYFLIQDGDVSISGTQEEWQMIKSALESGFYWE